MSAVDAVVEAGFDVDVAGVVVVVVAAAAAVAGVAASHSTHQGP